MRLKCLFLAYLLLSTVQVYAQYYRGDIDRIPQNAYLKLIDKKDIDNDYKYGCFMLNAQNEQLYINTTQKIVSVTTLLKKTAEKDADLLVVGDRIVSSIRSNNDKPYSNFIKFNTDIDGFAVFLPQHHLFSSQTRVLRDKGVNKERIVNKINELDFVTWKMINTKGGGFNMVYNRVFISDEDSTKFLIIWHKNNHLYANFLTNEGEWLMPEPKVIHKDVVCTEENGEVYQRSFDGSTDQSSLVTELNVIKENDNYYIGYSITTWENSTCFSTNLASCHISLLNSELDIIKTAQIPDVLESSKWFFATDLQMKIYKQDKTICAVIQSPNTGEDKLFTQLFDDQLTPISSLMLLSSKTSTYANLIPVTILPNGFLLTYKEIRKNSTDVYTQFISSEGKLSKPVSVFTNPPNSRISSMEVIQENDNLVYYFLMRETEPEKTYLLNYKISLPDYWDAVNYKITPDNWKENQKIKEIEKLVSQINSNTKSKKLVEFKRTLANSGKIKSAHVNKSFNIVKYTETNESSRDRLKITRQLYYNDYGTLRYIHVIYEKMAVIRAYFNEDADLIWSIRENADGSIITESTNREIRKNIKPVEKPFEEFHK